MKTRKWKLLAVVVVVLMAVVVLASVALAQEPTNSLGHRMGPENGFGRAGVAMGPHWGGSENSPITVIAEQLGMTVEELVAELQAGKTIAQVAEERGVALDTIVDALVAWHAERLAEAVAEGRLTQEQADAILENIQANITARLNGEGPRRGLGRGPGFVDEDGDGQCDHFVDEDGDGVCDNAGSGGCAGHGGGPEGRWAQ
jgi:hypothetical protein